ncbi:MAG: hypothetical protein KBT46_03060, partial [Ruminococcus sp.]|nr:hypothetical protein [Candidatus Copronaster equi]
MEQYIIYSNKYSLQERQTKHGKVYDVYFRIYDDKGNYKQKKIGGSKSKTEARERYNLFVAQHCTFETVRPKTAPESPSQPVQRTVKELIPEY